MWKSRKLKVDGLTRLSHALASLIGFMRAKKGADRVLSQVFEDEDVSERFYLWHGRIKLMEAKNGGSALWRKKYFPRLANLLKATNKIALTGHEEM